jgi:hypothetical protein
MASTSRTGRPRTIAWLGCLETAPFTEENRLTAKTTAKYGSGQPQLRADRCRLMCRFSDAGSDEPCARSGDRRLKSAKARNRGKWGHPRCRGLYGDLAAASGWARFGQSARLNCFASQDGCGVTGRTSAAGVAGQGWRCHCGPIYRPAVSGGYAGRASQNGERHWAGGSVVRAL